MTTLFQLEATDRFESEAHNETKWFEVKIARAERLCFATLRGDHDRATIVLGDCSSPIERFSSSESSCGGHSSVVKALTLKLMCTHGSKLDACCGFFP